MMAGRRGRPPIDATDPSVRVAFRLTSKQYDLAYRRATAARLTLSEYLRAVVAKAGRNVTR